ncbi:MAG TPA: heme-binding domain-containing protein [Chitinophagales bacterium]|nr:heme-binding domain-containing protein [Chitinophagales bacterium]
MSKTFKIVAGVILLLVVIQFFQPAKNEGQAYGPDDFTHTVAVSPEVKSLLEAACFDCHSNHTNPVWYMKIQPVGWWIGHHMNEGKQEINFSEFNTYTAKKKAHKMKEVIEQLQRGKMPISSYTWMHPEARLTDEQRNLLIQWATEASKSLPEADN